MFISVMGRQDQFPGQLGLILDQNIFSSYLRCLYVLCMNKLYHAGLQSVLSVMCEAINSSNNPLLMILFYFLHYDWLWMLNLTELNYSLLNIHVTLPVMVWTAHLHIHQDTQEGARGQVLGPTLPSGQSVTSPILSKKHKDSQNVLSVPRCTFTRVFLLAIIELCWRAFQQHSCMHQACRLLFFLG